MERAPARAMLRAVGMTDADFDKPQIAVASSWNEVTPCNLPLDRLAKHAKEGVRAAGGYPLEFTTIAVSDGISMGHEGMRASLVSREVIADSVELVMHAERLDGMVLLAGCDKSLPGMLMAAARLDLAAVFLYGGSILPGKVGDRVVTIQDAFEGVGACAAGRITREDLDAIERAACPSEGSCGGMFTANTMAAAAEALGMALTGSAAPPAVDKRREALAVRSGEAVLAQLDAGLTARQILTKEAFENAIAVVMALGGSTNAVLHLLAIAHEARVELTLDDFNRVGDRTPHLADVRPFGRYVMTDVDRIGGVPVVMRALLDAGVLHGDALTVTGRTLGEELEEIAPPDPDGKVVGIVGAVVLAGVARQRAIGAHRRPHAVDLVGRDRRAEAGAVDDDAGIDFAARHQPGHGAGGIGIVSRIGPLRPDLLHRQALAAQVIANRPTQGDPAVIAADGQARNRHARGQRRLVDRRPVADDGDSPLAQRVDSQRRDVAALGQDHRRAWLERARIGFRQHLVALHRPGLPVP